MAVIRLSEGRLLDGLVALPIPLRFVFILVGPNKPDFDYHEIGRSISTLMADKVGGQLHTHFINALKFLQIW